MTRAAAEPAPRAALPRPPRTLRTVTLAVMTACALVSGAFAFLLHYEAVYALRATEPRDLGAFADAEVEAHAGEYVRLRVTLEAPAATFRRALERSEYRLAKAGPDRWVIYAKPDGYPEQRFLPPTLVAGRLAPVSQLGARFGGVANVTGDGAWVLVDDDTPHGSTWILGLLALSLGFVLFNVVGIVRLVRPVR